jgi:xylitol oxidase
MGSVSARTNWAGNVRYWARTLHEPRSVEEVQDVVRGARCLRPLGSGHTFNQIADTGGEQLSLARLPRCFDLDTGAGTVTIDGGQRYGDLSRQLDEGGSALHNLASLAHISIAGACATGTHGSGQRNGTLATALEAVELVSADGALHSFRRGDAGFAAAATSLGALGVVTGLTLRIEPTYQVSQRVYEDVPIADTLEHLGDVLGAAHSVSLFTEWREPVIDQVWVKQRVDAGDRDPDPDVPGVLRRARPATVDRHPIRGISPENCTPQLGVAGPWHERLPHFRFDHTPSSGDELQTELFVPASDAAAAIEALMPLRERIARVVQVTEIRAIAADELWLSPAYGRDSVAIHFTWHPDPDAVAGLVTAVEAALEPFAPRPHWGKVFTMPADMVRARYPEMPRFVELARSLDPDGVFRNEFLDRHLGRH